MPLAALNPDGLLPGGIHDCTVDELKAGFGSFQGNDQRPRLFARLEIFLAEVRAAGLVRSILVDGSFVTSKPDPDDIDLILTVASDHDFSDDLSAAAYNVLSKQRVHRRYGFDLLVAREASIEYQRWTEFFQQVRLEPARRKGILRLTI